MRVIRPIFMQTVKRLGAPGDLRFSRGEMPFQRQMFFGITALLSFKAAIHPFIELPACVDTRT